MKMKRLYCLCMAALLCAVLAISAFAYPAGIDKSLPRVIDHAGLLTASEKSRLEARALALIEANDMDIVIVTTNTLDGKTPTAYSDDFFDYRGYGWRKTETNDITAGSGILVLVNMGERDLYFSTKGTGMTAFYDNALNHMYDNVRAQLGNQKYDAAFGAFLDDVEGYLGDYTSGTKDYYNASGGDTFIDYGGGGISPGTVVFVGLLLALLIAWLAVRSMKRKLNTARPQAAATSYMTQGSFRLTGQQDIFLYSTTTQTARAQESSSSGGGGYSSSGSHSSSSGSSHGGGGGKF